MSSAKELLFRYGRLREEQGHLLVLDWGNRSVLGIDAPEIPVRVDSALLVADVYVFSKVNGNQGAYVGWLPSAELEQAPIEWNVTDGQRTGYCHIVDLPFLIPMPDTFDFLASCIHKEQGGVWDDAYLGWRCFGCDRLVYDEVSREYILAYDARERDQVSSQEGRY